MNKEIMKQLGFSQHVIDVENKKCPLCKIAIDMNEFKDNLSVKEYYISGMCQNCQNKIFGY